MTSPTTAPSSPGGRVDPQLPCPQGEAVQVDRALPCLAPQQRARPGQEHGVGDGLGQIVVGAGVEALDLVQAVPEPCREPLLVLDDQHPPALTLRR
ncbi:hypothetical protein [Streptomyces chartreusis]